MNLLRRRRIRRIVAQHHARRRSIPATSAAEGDWASVFSADPGALWVIPEPVRITQRPPIPMTREQSRAWKRINRVAMSRDRWRTVHAVEQPRTMKGMP